MTWQLFILTDGKPVKNCWNGEMCSDLANIYLANSISFHDRINLNSVAQRTGLKQSSGISVFSTLPFHPSRPRNMKWKTEAAKFVGSDTIFNRSEIHHGKVAANWLQEEISTFLFWNKSFRIRSVPKGAFKKTSWWPSSSRAFKHMLNLEWLKIPTWREIFLFLKLSTCPRFYYEVPYEENIQSCENTDMRL